MNPYIKRFEDRCLQVSGMAFNATRTSNEIRLLRSKVGKFVQRSQLHGFAIFVGQKWDV